MYLREFLACFVLMLGGLSLLQLERLTFRKIGMALIWLSSGTAAYFLTNSVLLAALMLLAWMCFPLWEMLFVLRKLRVPRHRELADARAPRHEFTEVVEISGMLADLGFEQLDECRLRPAQHEQYYRIFRQKSGLTQAIIGWVSQGPIGFHFIAFNSDGRDGRRWITWDYPLTYGLIMPPQTAVFRALHCETVEDLHDAHLDFLKINGITPEDLMAIEATPEASRAQLEEALNQQIEYNISRGFLSPAADAEAENFCYSWRGTLYVAGQVLRDLLLF